MDQEYCIVKAYREDTDLRRSFNRLAGEIFGLDFEDWYQGGYWGDGYIPYSVVIGGEVAANVSVNRMVFESAPNPGAKPERLHLIQLGTVMTKPEYRNQGMIRALMQEIEKDYGEKTDGFYLFANDQVLDFYPRFGFRMEKETGYSKAVRNNGEQRAVPVSVAQEEKRIAEAVRTGVCHGAFDMVQNVGLIMFYLTKYMRNSVYYIGDDRAYVIADIEDGRLFLHQVIAQESVDTDRIVQAFGRKIHHVTFGFTPSDRYGCEKNEVREDDTVLFCKGRAFNGWKGEGRFPSLSHA